jgi:hypothetical protein
MSNLKRGIILNPGSGLADNNNEAPISVRLCQ